MKKIKKFSPFTYEVIKHFKSFNSKMGLDMRAPMVLAISGGVDSIVLLDILIKIGVNNLRLIHIDHGTRNEIASEVELVRSIAQQNMLQFESVKLNLSLKESNFESVAREQRYRIFKESLDTSEILLTAHHLDDCFEWSLMQQFKSSSKAIDFGMPYRNDRTYRPLFCLSKKQILKYARVNKLSWSEDISNQDISFERNSIRALIKASIAPKYPMYLKHYCNRMNQLAALNIKEDSYKIISRQWGLIIEHGGKIGQGIKDEILSLSNSGRGSVSEQFKKLDSLLATNKHGPLSLSGGIRVYCFGPYLFITKKGHELSFFDSTSHIPDGVAFLSKSDKSHQLKRSPINNEYLNSVFSNLNIPVQYSWRIAGKVVTWI